MNDTIPQKNDSTTAKPDVINVDSLAKNQSRAVQWNDSLAQIEDSVKKSRRGALEDPVAYEAKDSIVFMMDSKNAYLYGKGKVDYQNITLTSENITMNMDSSIVHAIGAVDSLGRLYGKPVFKQGKDEYRVRTGPGPDLPGSMVNMIQMVVCAEKCVHPFHLLHGNRRRNLPFRKPGGKIIDAEDG